MRFLVVTILSLLYASQAFLGHAGLHLLSGHHHETRLSQDSPSKGPESQVRIVRCFHAPGDKTPCDHEHHCEHDHAQRPTTPHHPDDAPVHNEEDCQLCHHLAQTAIPFCVVSVIEFSEQIIDVTTLHERYYHAVVVVLPLTRGPPVCFA